MKQKGAGRARAFLIAAVEEKLSVFSALACAPHGASHLYHYGLRFPQRSERCNAACDRVHSGRACCSLRLSPDKRRTLGDALHARRLCEQHRANFAFRNGLAEKEALSLRDARFSRH